MRTISDVDFSDVHLSPHMMPTPRVDSSAAKTAGALAGTSTASTAAGSANAASQASALYPAGLFWDDGMANLPIPSDPNDPRKKQDVALLDQAEALAQDAFQKVNQFHPVTAADRALAQQEMQQAEQIRDQVKADLTADQRQKLDLITSEEKQSIADESTLSGSFDFILARGFPVAGMADGAAKSKALDNSILGLPEPPPPFPNWLFQLGNLF